jgi:hypothetical protein
VLHVDVDGLVGAAGRVGAAPPAGVPAANVTAAGSDPVSVGVAHAVASQIAIIGSHTTAANQIAHRAAGRLQANAADYRAQERANTSGLGLGGVPAAVGTTGTDIPSITPTSPSLPALQSATAPTSGKHVAQLIHGGPGPDPLFAAASRLRSHADALRDTSFELRAAANSLDGSWFSAAATEAQGRIGALTDWYDSHAQTATTAAERAAAQGDNVSRARSAIPRPEEFERLESRLQTAVRANAQSKGAYSAVVAQLQSQLGALNAKAASGYADYTFAAATGLDAPLSPSPAERDAKSGPDDVIVHDGTDQQRTIQAVDFKQDGGPKPPPNTAPSTQGLPGPLKDFTDYQLQGKPIPQPPPPVVDENQLRQLIAQQQQDYEEYQKIWALQHPGCNGSDYLQILLGMAGGVGTTVISAPALIPPLSAVGVAGVLSGLGTMVAAGAASGKCWQ